MKKHIERIIVKHVEDENPDISWIGEFTDKADPWNIVREGEFSGQYIADLPEGAELPSKGREYRFFTPSAGGETPGSENYKANGLQDWERMEMLCRGDFCFVGVIAKSEIRVFGVSQFVSSGGLWGIESDSGDYLQEVANEQLEELAGILAEIGFGKRAINFALKNAEFPK
mgnify:CR=1 FL=1